MEAHAWTQVPILFDTLEQEDRIKSRRIRDLTNDVPLEPGWRRKWGNLKGHKGLVWSSELERLRPWWKSLMRAIGVDENTPMGHERLVRQELWRRQRESREVKERLRVLATKALPEGAPIPGLVEV